MNRKSKYGFTLIELIVALAILAIIAAVAVPTAFRSIENARKAACKGNESSIQSAWRVESANEEIAATGADYTARSDAEMLTDTLADCGLTQSGNSLSGLCPSGGTYTLKIQDGALEITCDVHDADAPPRGTTMGDSTAQQTLVNAFQSISGTLASMDYGALSDPNSKASEVVAALRESGMEMSDIKINDNSVTAWCAANVGAGKANQFYFTACDISNLADGTKVPVIMYTGSTNSFRVYNVAVKMATNSNGEIYKTLDRDNMTTLKWNPANYEEAEKAYLSSSFFK